MKLEQISEHIWSIKTWCIIPIHVWLVVDQDGVTLVDAGVPFMAKGIVKSVNKLDVGPLQRILLTHGHSDHVGAINKIKMGKDIPIYAHPIEIPYAVGEASYPGRKKPEKTLASQVIHPLEADDKGKMLTIGGLTPYLTPGHSPGHVAYYHERDGVLLAGDLFTSKKGKLHQPMPMFTADMKKAVKSSTILEQLQPKRLEICHGMSVFNPAKQVNNYIKRMNEKYV